MEFRPILSALRRNRVGALLVALQIALTLAVVSNAMAVIQHHVQDMTRPSGLDEANVFAMGNQWIGSPDDLSARIVADVAALRTVPGVVDAEATNSFPLSGNSWVQDVRLKHDQSGGSAMTSIFMDTSHGLQAQGLKLIAGRWFTQDEVHDLKFGDSKSAPSVVLSAALAKQLFPKGDALGQFVYVTNEEPERIVGIVERASSGAGGTSMFGGNVDFSTFLPFQLANTYMSYVVRTKPGQRAAAMVAARERLVALSRMRILSQPSTFAEYRKRLFAVPAATSWLLATVCALLLAITACGTVGLTMCWVTQRRQQIGTRRALGATRIDILRYFHTENLLISGAGALLGIACGLAANLWLATHLAVTRMSPVYICVGALSVLLLSQLAVLWPAVRAAGVPPSLAARGL